MEAFGLRALPADARDPLRLAFNVPGVSQSTGFFGDARPLVIHGDNALYTARDRGAVSSCPRPTSPPAASGASPA